jgi:hypothetical protein
MRAERLCGRLSVGGREEFRPLVPTAVSSSFAEGQNSMTAQYPIKPISPAVIIGGPISSGLMPPCASANVGRMTMEVRTAALILHRRWSIKLGCSLLNCVMYVISISQSFDVTSDWPHGQIPSNKLTDPVTREGRRPTERERHILRFT